MRIYIYIIIAIVAMALTGTGIWIYKDWKFQKAENARQTENGRQTRIGDSTGVIQQVLTKEEIKEFLQYRDKELLAKLTASGIKTNKVESIITHNYYYKDTTTQVTDVSPLINSIIKGIPDHQDFIDTTKCQTTKGSVVFSGKKLEIKINDREFKNKTDAVVYEERKQWKFLFIKSRFLGKRQFTAKNFNECGESKILKIEKRK